MTLNLEKMLAVLGIASLAYMPGNVNAQDFSSQSRNSSGLERSIENIEIERYNKISHTFSMGESLRDVENINTENLEKLEWLLDTYNEPIEVGDILTIIERESVDGIFYPYSIKLDYNDSEKEDLFLIGRKEDMGYAIRVDYHDSEGDLRRSLWTNKRNHSFFDVGVYEVEFPLEGFFEDYKLSISSPFGERRNPVRGIFGGPSINFHYGIDIPLPIGYPFRAPLDGSLMAGYVARETGDMGYDTFLHLGKVSEIRSRRIVRNSNRRLEAQNIVFQFFHISDYPENIKEEFVEHRLDRANIPENRVEEFRNWYHWILSEQDEELIFNNLQQHGMRSYFFRGVNVDKGDVFAYNGNTGLSTAPHMHLGILVNGRFVDPEEFYNLYGRRSGITKEEFQQDYEKYNFIKNSL